MVKCDEYIDYFTQASEPNVEVCLIIFAIYMAVFDAPVRAKQGGVRVVWWTNTIGGNAIICSFDSGRLD